jgi:hypothetical protein
VANLIDPSIIVLKTFSDNEAIGWVHREINIAYQVKGVSSITQRVRIASSWHFFHSSPALSITQKPVPLQYKMKFDQIDVLGHISSLITCLHVMQQS